MNATEHFIRTANAKEMRRLARELNIVNEDRTFDEFIFFIHKLIKSMESTAK